MKKDFFTESINSSWRSKNLPLLRSHHIKSVERNLPTIFHGLSARVEKNRNPSTEIENPSFSYHQNATKYSTIKSQNTFITFN